MISRQGTSQREDQGWFQFASSLMHVVCSDYIALRMLGQLEPLTTAMAVAPKMLDVVEKALKLHLAVQRQSPTALTDAMDFGHDVEKLRAECAAYHSVFDDDDVRAFTHHLNDRAGTLYQYMRYGSQITTKGHSIEYGALPVVDKVFVKSVVLLPESFRRFFYCSPLNALITRSPTDQTRHPDQVLRLLADGNAYFDELVELCRQLNEEQLALRHQLDETETRDGETRSVS